MESRRPICEGPPLPIVEEEHAEHLIEDSIPTSFSIETTLNQPLPTHDSLTPECESDNVIDHKPWLHAKKESKYILISLWNFFNVSIFTYIILTICLNTNLL